MPALEIYDTVVLKANRQLIGVVERTHYENHDPLSDLLIIAHVQVDQTALTEFVTSGRPPKNHVFLVFADETQGSCLVHEDDVVLLDRSLGLGDVVKRQNDHMLGTVTSVHESYVIQPVWGHAQKLDGTITATPISQLRYQESHVCSPQCPFGVLTDVEHPRQDCLLRNIPGEELKRAEDVLETDFILQGDWVGIAEEIELVVVVLLEDESIVVVSDSDELYIPVPDSGKPLVSLPEFDNLARPDPLVALPGWSATIPPHDFRCGQMVITNPWNLRQGRWLRGHYTPGTKPQGYILDIRTKGMDVKWLACNAFIPEHPVNIEYPQTRLAVYDNINTFPNRLELRSNKQVSIYDQHRVPRTTEDRTRRATSNIPPIQSARSPTDFRVGDHAKFRDQAGAALKYQGTPSNTGVVHGKFDRISAVTTYGFDVNEFKIISSKQECTVLWQDGTSTHHSSKTLTKFTLFEPDLAPADLVVAREGMKQSPVRSTLDMIRAHAGHEPENTDYSVVDFNEMKFFEEPHELLPARVGIIQNVDQAERVAQVRWFAEPNIRLTDYGHVLSPSSRFGKLSDFLEDVSLYEIMTFPALMRRLKDPVIVPPGTASSEAIDNLPRLPEATQLRHAGQASLSQINAKCSSYDPYDLLLWLQATGLAVTRDMKTPSPTDSASYKLHPTTDWFGEIVRLGLDGIVTVRLNTRDMCLDIRLEHDQLICLIDDVAIGNAAMMHDIDALDSEMDLSSNESTGFDTTSTRSETVEYEGGERLDTDSGDENWEDDDDDNDDDDEEDIRATSEPLPISQPEPVTLAKAMAGTAYEGEHSSYVEQSRQTVAPHTGQPQRAESKSLFASLKPYLETTEPPSFLVLESEPPSDQYKISDEEFTSSPVFFKRIMREHRILASSLPKGEIFVRTYESRLDLLRCLIIGPRDTPYEYAPFLFDLHLGKNFPREPPVAHFHSWTSGLGRINPNLYEEGKICLSLLGTWPGRAEHEGWSEKATILQLLVSLQGLVFVRQPFYNEAGFEDYVEDAAYVMEAQRYNEKAYLMARGFVKHAVSAPVTGLEDALAWTYLSHGGNEGLLHAVISRSRRLIEYSENDAPDDVLVDGTGSRENPTTVFLRPLSRGAVVMLRKTIRVLEDLNTGGEDTNMIDAATET